MNQQCIRISLYYGSPNLAFFESRDMRDWGSQISRNCEIVLFTKKCQFCQSKWLYDHGKVTRWENFFLNFMKIWISEINFQCSDGQKYRMTMKYEGKLLNVTKKYRKTTYLESRETQTINLARFDFAHKNWISRALLAEMRSTWRSSFWDQIQGLWALLGLKDARKWMEL